jgi:hypothetical protein
MNQPTNSMQLNQPTNSMQQISTSEASSSSRTQEKLSIFLEPEGSLPCSQNLATGPYPKPHSPILRTVEKLSFHLLIGHQGGLFPMRYPK